MPFATTNDGVRLDYEETGAGTGLFLWTVRRGSSQLGAAAAPLRKG